MPKAHLFSLVVNGIGVYKVEAKFSLLSMAVEVVVNIDTVTSPFSYQSTRDSGSL